MASNDTGKMVISNASIYFGTAETTPSTAVGYTPRGIISCSISRRDGKFHSGQADLPIAIDNSIEGVTVNAGVWQLEADLVALAMGIAEDGNEVNLTGAGTYLEKSIKILGTNQDGDEVSIVLPRAKTMSDVSLAFGDEPTSVPLSFEAMQPSTGNAFEFKKGDGNTTATLSSGVLTRVAGEGYHKVAGEDGAADTLDSIGGASLTNGETLRLQIADASDSITLAHLADTLELDGSANWTMASVYDYIDLQYNTTGTKWVEIGRYNHTIAS